MPVDLLLVPSFTCALLGAFRVSDEMDAANCACLRSATRGVLVTTMVTREDRKHVVSTTPTPKARSKYTGVVQKYGLFGNVQSSQKGKGLE